MKKNKKTKKKQKICPLYIIIFVFLLYKIPNFVRCGKSWVVSWPMTNHSVLTPFAVIGLSWERGCHTAYNSGKFYIYILILLLVKLN